MKFWARVLESILTPKTASLEPAAVGSEISFCGDRCSAFRLHLSCGGQCYRERARGAVAPRRRAYALRKLHTV